VLDKIEERGMRMEDSRQDLRTEYRGGAESSGLACPRSSRRAGFGLASAVE
jgi:hypothetical protein